MTVLLVDVANAVGSRPDGWWRDRPGAATRLAEQLVAALDAGALDTDRVHLVLEGAARALFVVADAVKPTSADTVRALTALGLRPVLLTGDHEATARAVRSHTGALASDAAAIASCRSR